MTIRVLIVDDHHLIREGLRRAFERTEDFSVVAEAPTIGEARRLALETAPDVVVTDVRLPDGTGLDLTRWLREAQSHVGIVILTMFAGDESLLAALEAGASAFVSKDSPSSEVISAARRAAAAPRTFAAQDLAAAVQRRTSPTRAPQLSSREAEVLNLLAEGLSVAAISQSLYISPSTAKTHIARIYEKLGAANRAQAIMKAIRAGLLAGGMSASGDISLT